MFAKVVELLLTVALRANPGALTAAEDLFAYGCPLQMEKTCKSHLPPPLSVTCELVRTRGDRGVVYDAKKSYDLAKEAGNYGSEFALMEL